MRNIYINEDGLKSKNFSDHINDYISEFFGEKYYSYRFPYDLDFEDNETNCYSVILTNKEPNGNLFDCKFIICKFLHNNHYGFWNEQVDFEWLKYFTCKVMHGLLYFLIVDEWIASNYIKPQFIFYRSLFAEKEIVISSSIVSSKTYIHISYLKKEFELKMQDEMAINYWNGTMPKEIYYDYVKQLPIYSSVVNSLYQ